MFKKYLTTSTQVDLFLSRDLDSRFSEREQEAVYEWVNGEKIFHIIRDHPEHGTSILGGTWGCKLPPMVRFLFCNKNGVRSKP